ncbi:MAG: hypothetical protein ABS85_08925 [Sphingobacteriales bacterium SCN 48-20]|jgi:acyl carrier protein|uniref:acyl carrier protein n=1 Tax=Terrimonas ferruginea TaxID=249 RepID=UPI00040CD833|nr:phosphopantetheine-binding protein [Terrimonas ferruginea]MBN8783536.1 acyl carrier protein [Terrimonas ferruginea]ODT92587.1 MAG: hypothetical protein ABS85_08925 [Sphingobacteriales bacterium SCN 48-20]OJW40291.1 MAG: hypothetical protein BGO56_09560 [Sphingobacteriales bacterium 48-107]
MEESVIIADIRQFIETNILAGGVELTPDTNLQQAGIDSFSTVEIILFLERNFNTPVPDDKLLPENFQTLRSLARLVRELSATN